MNDKFRSGSVRMIGVQRYVCPVCGNEQQAHGDSRVCCRECGFVIREDEKEELNYIR